MDPISERAAEPVAATVAAAASPAAATLPPVAPPATLGELRRTQAALNGRIHRLLGIVVAGGVLYTCYFAAELIVPILLAAFFALLLNPLMRRLTAQRWLPRWLAALVLISLFLGVLGGIANALYPAASEWVGRAPAVLREATPRLKALTRPFQEASKVTASLGEIAGDEEARRSRVVLQAPARVSLLAATPRALAGVLAVVLLTYFFLLYGDTLLRRILMLRPTWAAKRLTVDIVRSIQNDVSRYFLTVCCTSLGLGVATAGLLWLLGVDTPLLWGALAALLNLTPYVGPLVMAALLALVGLAQFPTLGAALLPAAGYLGLHTLESQVFTPLVLGHTVNLNPLAIIVWLMIWGWLWGILGLLLAVPMLVCFKIVCSRVESLQDFAILLEK